MSEFQRYQNQLTVGEGLDQYFADTGVDVSSYDKEWIQASIGPITVYTWNPPSRKRTLPLHDIHHVVTEYGVNWVGEAEVASWELGSGCSSCFVGWYFDLFVQFQGLYLAPRRVFQAFFRGRRSKNLFKQHYHEGMLAENLGELRRRLEVPPGPVSPRLQDIAMLVLFLFMGLCVTVLNYTVGPIVLSLPYIVRWRRPEQFQVIPPNPVATSRSPMTS